MNNQFCFTQRTSLLFLHAYALRSYFYHPIFLCHPSITYMFCFAFAWKTKRFPILGHFFRDGSRITATSKMECFVVIVNGWKPLTVITKHSILDFAAALDPSLLLHHINKISHYFLCLRKLIYLNVYKLPLWCLSRSWYTFIWPLNFGQLINPELLVNLRLVWQFLLTH